MHFQLQIDCPFCILEKKTGFKKYFEHGESKNMHDLSFPETNEPSNVTQLYQCSVVTYDVKAE